MSKTIDNTPVLVGVGQAVWQDKKLSEENDSPLDLAAQVADKALADTGHAESITAALDTIAMVRMVSDCLPGPLSTSNNPPRSVARRIGANPSRAIYGELGGQSPQTLINEVAEGIANGEMQLALIVGAETIAQSKKAIRQGLVLDWAERVEGSLDDRGMGKALSSAAEVHHGIWLPTQVYPLFEHAFRARRQHSIEEHLVAMGELFAPFSAVAATNPYARFSQSYSARELIEASAENYPISSPYTKRLVAQDNVNQSAAVVMTSVDMARKLGINDSQWIYLHGYASASDHYLLQRPDLSRSLPIELTARRALSSAKLSIDDISYFDIYSCFPCAVFIACESLGIEPNDPRGLTLTGGLPFFGGAGNNYSMHAVVEMAQRLRTAPDAYGLITANGGYLSKQSIAVYSAQPYPGVWKPVSSSDLQSTIDQMSLPIIDTQPDGCGVIETYSVGYKKGRPETGIVVGRMVDTDARFIARSASDDQSSVVRMLESDPLGTIIHVETFSETSHFSFVE